MIPVNVPRLAGNELKYLTECIETGWISSEGPFVHRFEEQFAQSVQRRFGIACSSGSGALDIAVAAAGIGPGDEVILPAFTIISPAASVVRAGAVPVLIDSDLSTWNMDVRQIEDSITDRTRAILVVHIYGLPVDLDPVLETARRHGLTVIEDAAEMHGQTYRGRPCGSFGHLSTFSFYANKHITCGEGGMVVTDDEDLADRCREYRNLCFQKERRFVHERLGWNYRMTNIQAAVGLAQLEQLSDHIRAKRELGRAYAEELAGIDGLILPPASADYAENIYWVFGVLCSAAARLSAEELTRQLGQRHIGTRPFFWPMHRQPVFLKQGLFAGQSFPGAEYLADHGLYLPSGLGTTLDDVRTVTRHVRELLG